MKKFDIKTKRYVFDFSISYAGEEEGIARDLERLLTEKGASVYLAATMKPELLGRNLKIEFRQRFGENAHYFVPIISKNYVRKDYPQLEFSAALSEMPRRNYGHILPLLLDEVKQPGLDPAIGYLDIRKEGIIAVADTLITKLSREARIPSQAGEVKYMVATFGVNIDELFQYHLLPPEAPTYYPNLCDWLNNDIKIRLLSSGLNDISDVLEDDRNGETYSVRFTFKWNTKHPLYFGDLGWWKVLEVAEFDEVYTDENLAKLLGWDS